MEKIFFISSDEKWILAQGHFKVIFNFGATWTKISVFWHTDTEFPIFIVFYQNRRNYTKPFFILRTITQLFTFFIFITQRQGWNFVIIINEIQKQTFYLPRGSKWYFRAMCVKKSFVILTVVFHFDRNFRCLNPCWSLYVPHQFSQPNCKKQKKNLY